MNGGLPTGSLIPPNADPAEMQFYLNERYSTGTRIDASASPAVPSILITIPYIFTFSSARARTEEFKETMRERLALVAKTYPESALQITSLSFRASTNFWGQVAINVSLIPKSPGASFQPRVLKRTAAIGSEMVTAVIQPNGSADVCVFAIPPKDVVRPHALCAPCTDKTGIASMNSVVYPNYDAKIMGVVCRMVPLSSHLGVYLKNRAAREEPGFLSKHTASLPGGAFDFYAVYENSFAALYTDMIENERLKLYLDDIMNGVQDFAICVMPKVGPLGGADASFEDILSHNPLIAVSLMNPSDPQEEVADRWNNVYTVTVECVVEFSAHKRSD